MTQEELSQIESSQRQHYETMLFQDRQFTVVQKAEYALFEQLKPKLHQDGNQWCVLYGDDIQIGIVGFGDTPYLAILDWNSQWSKKITTK